MNQFRRTGVLGITFLTLTAGLACAENEPRQIGDFQDWTAYSYDAADSKVCYVSSTPRATEPKGVKRDPAFFLVTNMPGRKPPVRGEVSTIIGYPFKEGEPVRLTIDGQAYEMFSKGDTAWVDTGSDKKIVAAMKGGKSLKVKGTSSRGKTTEDTYSLQGISAALAAIDKACK
ncbi:invasion associated locus B family protein [Aestuariivirga sp.]|uniref:invasion associated locus B family protein n=1 Tax=Aestuariivirga sp. TaxID=2650926 RepID=UPI0025BDC4BE|nr:invasion associated locus B family protein [Aestuariivirga sp.]MCA3554705.1 invasion associated locus B family protein [Aestuariivirga sp.]